MSLLMMQLSCRRTKAGCKPLSLSMCGPQKAKGLGKMPRPSRNWLAGVGEDANYEYSIPRPNATPEFPKIRKRDRDRAEAIRLAGGPKPSLRDRAVALALERGTVRTRDLTEMGIPRCYLTRMCDEGLLEKVSYGVYRAAVRKAA
ncbi:MAG TPA: type IV toxin-antitoxin system AbiEi family antitoxin domain-containing protein [Terriglobia bacterium]|nr:type IV toxin-antitoxin system AbiEi family antitoxin domain-containing protein [Terriglobia bacterium]